MVKRFIAGAICPKCQAVDTLSVEFVDGEPQSRRCVSCGFEDDAAAMTGQVPRGRLEKPRAPDETVQVVRLPGDLGEES